MPLTIFVFVGEFLEEIISPIPSFVVLVPAGAAAHVQQAGWWYVLLLAIIGAAGRLVASIVLYILADKGENLLFGKGRRFFGVTHKQLEQYGERLGGSARGWIGLFLLNAVPVLPTSILSLTCGFIKVPVNTFLTATFLGTIISAFFYLGIGFAGLQLASELKHLDTAFQITAIVFVVALAGWLVYYRRSHRRR